MPGRAQVTPLSDRVVLVSLKIGAAGTVKQIGKDRIRTTADKSRVGAHKRTMQGPELQAIGRLDTAAREFFKNPIRGIGFPGIVGRGGLYVVPLASFERAERFLADYQTDREGLIAVLRDGYATLVEEGQRGLGDLGRERDYLGVDEFCSRFYVKVQYLSLGVPGNIPDAARVREEDRLRQMWLDAEQEIRVALRLGFAELVKHAADRLESANGRGKVKRFRADAMQEKWDGFFATFRERNLTGDAELSALVTQARALLQGVDLEDLKDDRRARREIARGMAEVKAALEPLLEDAPTRRIRLEAVPEE